MIIYLDGKITFYLVPTISKKYINIQSRTSEELADAEVATYQSD